MSNKIKAGIIGIGSCAKSLVEGVQYYNENPEDKVREYFNIKCSYILNKMTIESIMSL